MPIVISSFFGALAMVADEGHNLASSNARALDLKIITTIAAALALGVAMEATGAATYLANLISISDRNGKPNHCAKLVFPDDCVDVEYYQHQDLRGAFCAYWPTYRC